MKTDKFDNTEIPSDLESKLEALIDRLSQNEIRRKRQRKTLLYSFSIAACFAFLLASGIFFTRDSKPVNKNVITDPDIAYIEAVKALALISTEFNNAMGQLEQLNIISDEIENINYIINEIKNN